MPTRTDYVYWDTSVFSSYVGAIPDRLPIIDALFEQVANTSRTKIITSGISILEVAFASGHGPARRMPPEIEATIDEIWRSPNVEIVDVNSYLLYEARDLMRRTVDQGWSMGPNDALHLATAIWVNQTIGMVLKIHTYDNWTRFTAMVGGIPISEPHVTQPSLPFGIQA